MAANTCFSSTCSCCPCAGVATNQCCPGQCWQNLHLTVTDTSPGDGCTKVIPLSWNANEPFDCGDVATTGCWVAHNVAFGNCIYTVRVSCTKQSGICAFVTEFLAVVGPNAPNHFCFTQVTKQCNPLLVAFVYAQTIPISAVCGCADQAPKADGTLTI